MDLSIITTTHGSRRRFVANLLGMAKSQAVQGMQFEHIVVSDGKDPWLPTICSGFGARYKPLATPQGKCGGPAKDHGIREARGDYILFWDDDICVYPHAAATMFAAAYGHDMGVCQIRHWEPEEALRIPQWDGQFRYGNIDTLCVCVRRTLATRVKWTESATKPDHSGNDCDWLTALARLGTAIHFVPIIIGEHVGAVHDHHWGSRCNATGDIERRDQPALPKCPSTPFRIARRWARKLKRSFQTASSPNFR